MIFCTILILTIILWIRYIWLKKEIYILAWKLPGPFAWPLIGNALEFLCPEEGLKWKRDRRLMGPMFLQKRVNEYFPIVLSHSKRLADIMMRYVDNEEFPVDRYLHRTVSDIVNESIIGVKTDFHDGSMDAFLHAISRLYVIGHNRMIKVWMQSDFLFKLSYCYEEYQTFKKIVQDFMRNITSQALQSGLNRIQTKKYSKVVPLLDKLLAMRQENPWFATDEELVHHLSTLYTAAEDTVMQISSFTLVLLGMHPLIQYKVAEEISHIIGRRDVELSDLESLVYLDRCIKDVMRLFPIAPFIMRTPSEDVTFDRPRRQGFCQRFIEHFNDNDGAMEKGMFTDESWFHLSGYVNSQNMRMWRTDNPHFIIEAPLHPQKNGVWASVTQRRIIGPIFFEGNITLPKGCSVVVSIQNIHRDTRLWEKPNEFYPDHFLPDAVKNRSFYAFLPFSAGPRGCIGKSYAYMALKTLLATFIQNYMVETDRKFEDIRLKSDISVRFRDDCYNIRIKRRM